MTIDPRSVTGSEDDPEPITMPLEYDAESGVITFDLAETCGTEATCTMEGEALVVDGAETITAVIGLTSEDYSALADIEVLRKP